MTYETLETQRKLTRLLTFIMVFASMTLGLSLVPLLPLQPFYILPVIISLLIAFAAFKKPKSGMATGSLLIGLGLIYHLSEIGFISALGDFECVAFLFAIFALFIFTPYGIESYEDAITIAVGIIAATLLFSDQTYYLAIPLIVIFAVLYKRARLSLTLSYYILIALPLQMMEFLYRQQVYREEVYPPILVPLRTICDKFQKSMSQLTFVEIKRVLDTIISQFYPQTQASSEVTQGLAKYMNSLPGMVIFLIILFSLVSASAFVVLIVLRTLKGVERTKKYAKYLEIFLPAMTATSVISAFWFLLTILTARPNQSSPTPPPLALVADIDPAQIMISTLVTIGLTLPASIVSYTLNTRAMIEELSRSLINEAQTLLKRLEGFDGDLNHVKTSTPVAIGSVENKELMIKDKLNDIVSKALRRVYDIPSLDEKFNEVKNIDNEINGLWPELNVLLEEYYTQTVYEYLGWIEKLKELGVEVKTVVQTVDVEVFRKQFAVDAKVEKINKVLNGGKVIAEEGVQTFSQIYDIVRTLFDPKLPAESPTLKFARQTLEEKTTPWIVIESLFVSLQNLEKQYSAEISKSIEHLQKSLSSMAEMGAQNERFFPILGGSLSEMIELSKKAQDIRIGFEAKGLSVMKVVLMKEALQSTLNVSRDALQVLHREIKRRMELIERLLPVKEYEWGKNVTLLEGLESTIGVLSSPSDYSLEIVIDSLYKSLVHVEECIGTIDAYNKESELMLNYPIAVLAIEKMLNNTKHVYAQDLPFRFEYAKEYLKLYSKQKYTEVSFDDVNALLIERGESDHL